MLHDISPGQLRVGMYITSFNQSWMAVPFWRRRFLVSGPKVLAQVLASGVETITIDDTRGIGPRHDAPPPPDQPAAADAPPVVPIVERRRRQRPSGRPDEFDRARTAVNRSKAAMIDMFAQARLGHAVETSALEPLVDEIAASVARDQTAIISVTRLKNKDEYTYLHSVAVCALMMNLARQLGMDDAQVRLAGLAGMLHDIGKMGVPMELLDKPGKLDDGERLVVQQHPEHGHALLSRSGGAADVVLDVCLHHHERMDGTGYPHGLTGDQLSVFARMGAICDVYDAVTSERAYKSPWPPGIALARMVSWEGHFDPYLLRVFINSLGIFPVGGLVRLHSNRLAIVLSEDPSGPTTPLVRAFHDVEANEPVAIEDVHTDRGDPILKGESGTYWFGESWPELARHLGTARPGDRVDSRRPSAATARRAVA